MNIFFESPQRLKIELSGTDLSELGITYDELDYKSERTRNVVRELLHRIGADAEFGAQNKMLIEIFPRGEDGCTMYFTTVREGAPIVRRRTHEITVWEFDCAEALMRAVDCLKQRNFIIKISLYLLGGKYRLVINDHIDKAFAMTVGEFAHKCGERHSALFTAEHGKLISTDLLSDMV